MEGVGGGSAFGGGVDGMEAALRRPMEAGLHRKVTGEGQDRRSEEILEGNEGEQGLASVTECGGENDGGSSRVVRKMEKEGGAELYSRVGIVVRLEQWHTWHQATQQGGGSAAGSQQ
jgi:hypothetical protein